MFTSNGSTWLQMIIDFGYRCTLINLPGTNVSIFAFFIGCLITVFVIKLVSSLLGLVPGGDSVVSSIRKSEIKNNGGSKK